MAKRYRYFLFEDYETDIQFLVEDETLGKAIETAKIYFADPSYMEEYTWEEVEASSYNVY